MDYRLAQAMNISNEKYSRMEINKLEKRLEVLRKEANDRLNNGEFSFNDINTEMKEIEIKLDFLKGLVSIG